ncbi:kinesin-like protein KIF20A [Cynoglossus semilaevis]|uniref:kinesin-like protein KIF20A n=1 Tax=Cynoglossus semilaevis TaxID=244447 RepID=UPI000497C809|nr:kinesin-like protein KIF20A [Cynoglossus semilaevis]
MSTVSEESIHQPMDMDLTCQAPPENSSPQESEEAGVAEQQTMRVYLRVRPFSKEELSDHEDQDCVVVENSQMVTLNAPKGSATLKNSEKSIHKFSFSKIFGPETTQAQLYEDTVKSQTSDFLDGKNALIFSYGVTNAGKTFTIQGTQKDPGILPRVLDTTFQHIGSDQYGGMDLKPYLRNDVQCLDPDQVRQERSTKAAIFASVKEEGEHQRASSLSESTACPSPTLSFSSLSYNQSEFNSSQFALWVAFFEIYNECVYDLLQPSLCTKTKKRAALRVCDDGAGNAYVKDVRWINIQSLADANKLLQFGNKNRSAASTKMNQSSSRSHSIFTMKLLKIENGLVERISEFSLCDLAGSERCNKTKTFGERLKEAGNINNSLLILGKTSLRNKQTDGRIKSSYVPFRESKLTKLFQAFFCGKGRASMIVNINQCASTYDETLHVMKFSAVAKQVVQVIPEKPLASLAPCLVGRDGKPLVRSGMIDNQDLESYMSEEELLDDEDEADMSMLPQDELVNMIEMLRTKLLAERRRNLTQEMEIRKEMGDAMIQQIMESEELHARQIEELKERYQEKLEDTFEMYKDAIKEHAYQSAMNNLEDDYVPIDEFIAEEEKVEALKRRVAELEKTGVSAVSSTAHSSQTKSSEQQQPGDERYKRLYKEKCVVEKMCVDKQQLIVSLEKRLMDLSETLQMVRDGFVKKSAELEDLQRRSNDKIAGKDEEISCLKAELENLSQKAKPKRGLLANIKDAVTSPRKHGSDRILRKTIRTPHH